MCGAWAFLSLNFISSPAHTAEQNTFLTEGQVGFNAQKIHPLSCCLDSPVLALLSLSRNAGHTLPALRDRERGARPGVFFRRPNSE